MSVTFNSIAKDKNDPWEQPPRLLTSELPINGDTKKPKITKNATKENRQKTAIKRHVERVEKRFVNDLKNKYPLGYALFYVDKDSWYYEPKNVGLKVD